MGLLNYSYKEFTKRMKKLGYVFKRQGKGSHEIWFNPKSGNDFVVPNHGNYISIGVVKSLIKQCELTNKSFKNI